MARSLPLAVAFYLLTLLPIAAVDAKVFRFEETHEYAVNDGFKLTVANTAGSIVVSKKPSDKVILHIIMEIDESSREKAEELEDLLEVDVDAAADRIDIEARYPENRGARGFLEELISRGRGFPGIVNFEIEIPGTVDLRASSTSGDIELTGIHGTIHAGATSGAIFVLSAEAPCDIKATSGDIHLKDVKGGVDVTATSGEVVLESVTGDINLQATSGDTELLWVSGSVRISKTSGMIRAEKCSGDIDFKSTSGDVTIDHREGEISVSTTSGNVEVNSDFSKGKRYEIETVSGDIRVKAPAEIKGDLRLETLSGSIDTDLALEVRSLSRRKIDGRIGGGGVAIELRSTSGNIVLEEF